MGRFTRTILCFGACLLTGYAVLAAQGQFFGTVMVTASIRTGPDRSYPMIATANAGDTIIAQARNQDASWLFVLLKDARKGWIMSRQVNFSSSVDLTTLPLSTTILNLESGIVPPTTNPAVLPSQTPPAQESVGSTILVLNPLVYAAHITSAVRAAMKDVYQKGLVLGNNPHAFSKVGDCHSSHVWFMHQFGGQYSYNLGQYTNLKGVIDWFSTPNDFTDNNSFLRVSQAAHSGFVSASVLDPLWKADQAFCPRGESPLRCEYRIHKPGVAIIQFGILDPDFLPFGDFQASMTAIVDQSLELGVIPIVSTAPINPVYPDKAHQFNAFVIQLAQSRNIPYIDLASVLDFLPNHGLDVDNLHMTPAAHFGRVEFAGPNLNTGLTLWNLLALDSLNSVWQQIMT